MPREIQNQTQARIAVRLDRWMGLMLASCALLLAVTHPAFGCDGEDRLFGKDAEPFEFSVAITAEGRALAGAKVQCVFAGLRNSTSFGSTLITNPDGKVLIRSRASRFKLLVKHPDFRREVSDWLTAEDVADEPVVLDLKRGVRLYGRVLDALGAPVAGASLQLHDPALSDRVIHAWRENAVAMPARIQADASGAFEFEPVLGKLTLVVFAPDGALSEQVLELAVGHETDADGRRELAVRLKDGPSVSGHIELDGQPVADVYLEWVCSDHPYPEGKQLSEPRGGFTLKQLRGKEACAVSAVPRSDLSRYSKSVAIGGFMAAHVSAGIGDRDILLSLRSEETPGSLTIRFDGAYESYTGEFKLTPLGAIRTTTPTRVMKRYSSPSEAPFAALRPGEYSLQADLDNGMDPKPIEVRIESGRETIVTLEVPDGMVRGTAIGRAVDAETGRPLSRVSISQSQRHIVTMNIPLDEDGRFRFDFVAENIEIELKRDSYHDVSLSISVGSGESAELGDIPMERQSSPFTLD